MTTVIFCIIILHYSKVNNNLIARQVVKSVGPHSKGGNWNGKKEIFN